MLPSTALSSKEVIFKIQTSFPRSLRLFQVLQAADKKDDNSNNPNAQDPTAVTLSDTDSELTVGTIDPEKESLDKTVSTPTKQPNSDTNTQ